MDSFLEFLGSHFDCAPARWSNLDICHFV